MLAVMAFLPFQKFKGTGGTKCVLVVLEFGVLNMGCNFAKGHAFFFDFIEPILQGVVCNGTDDNIIVRAYKFFVCSVVVNEFGPLFVGLETFDFQGAAFNAI